MDWKRWLLLGIVLVLVGGGIGSHSRPTPVAAQVNCGVIDSADDLQMPLDSKEFSLIQPFARPSGRFEGKLHAGEDYVARRRSETYGKPVHAIADGLVTYSDPFGWGRDKGLVIVQHTLLDGTIFYSLYGHLEEVNDILFVPYNTCVKKGDVVGAIGSPRPAPHLHFEIRNFSPNAPGPGYWEVDPRIRGWYNPRQFIVNWQAWLNPAHAWHRTLIDPSGPRLPGLMREDGVLLMLDDNMLRAYDGAGGRLWEYRLADSIVPIGFSKYGTENLLIANEDGRLQVWHQNGGYLYEWNAGRVLAQAPVVWDDIVLVRSEDNYLAVFGANRSFLSQHAEIAEITSTASNGDTLALLTLAPEFLLLNRAGDIIYRQEIRLGSDVLAAPNGGFYLRDQGTLEYVSAEGEHETILEELSVNRSDREMLLASDGNLIMWGINGADRLISINPTTGEINWETDLDDPDPNILGAQLIQANSCTLVLGERRGRLYAFNLRDGQLVQEMTLWGSNLNGAWLGASGLDTVLRVHIGDQLTGINLEAWTGACTE